MLISRWEQYSIMELPTKSSQYLSNIEKNTSKLDNETGHDIIYDINILCQVSTAAASQKPKATKPQNLALRPGHLVNRLASALWTSSITCKPVWARLLRLDDATQGNDATLSRIVPCYCCLVLGYRKSTVENKTTTPWLKDERAPVKSSDQHNKVTKVRKPTNKPVTEPINTKLSLWYVPAPHSSPFPTVRGGGRLKSGPATGPCWSRNPSYYLPSQTCLPPHQTSPIQPAEEEEPGKCRSWRKPSRSTAAQQGQSSYNAL